MPRSIITLTTDFGTSDHFVGVMKGVILGLHPDAQVVDITHQIDPYAISEGGFVVAEAYRWFPKKTVHVVVVDPGVGTLRRPILAEAAGQYFLAPDNGVLSMIYAREKHKVRAVTAEKFFLQPVSDTFHGRDVFAPAAARLATGAALQDLGAALADPVRLPTPLLRVEAGDLVGEVIHVDRFGTLVTNLPREHVAPDGRVRVAGHDLPLKATFADVGQREPVAFVGSGGALEIAVRDGRADVVLGLSRGTEVRATARRS